MSEVKRYDPAQRGFNKAPMEEDIDGEYVKYEDILPLIEVLQFFASENLYSMDSFVTSTVIHDLENPTNIRVNENPILHLGLDKARKALASVGV